MNAHFPPAPFQGDPQTPATVDFGRGLDAPYGGYRSPEDGGDSARTGATVLWLLHLAVKHKLIILSFLGVGVLAAFITTYLATPIYRATTTIQIDSRAPRVLNKDTLSLDSTEPFFYQTQYELLKSRSLAERVAGSLNLPEQRSPVSGWSKLRSLLAGGSPTPFEDRSAATAEARHRELVGQIMGGLSVQPVPMSRIVQINFQGPDPQVARQISVAVAENFVAATLDRRFNASSYARDFLQERLQHAKLKLEETERQLVSYAQKEGIVNVDEKQPQVNANLTAMNTALGVATAERVKNEQLWLQAQSGNAMSLPQVLSNKSVQAASEKRVQLMADYQDKLSLYKPAFPEMMQLRAQIGELDRQIKNQVELVKESLRTQYEAARAQETSFQKEVEALKNDVLDLKGRSIEYTILQREVDTNRTLYDGLLQQFKEIGVAAASESSNVAIVDRAQVPGGPISPSLRKNLMYAMVLGLLAAAGAIFLLEILNDTFKSPEEVEESLGLTVLGMTPKTKSGGTTNTIQQVLLEPSSAVAEAYRSLRTALQFSTESGAPKTLLVTSSRPAEGKSTSAICLAANFAQIGMRVLLIDADMRSPSLHAYLENDNSAGLSNYLSGAGEASQLVKTCSIPGVTFMASGPVPPNPAELLATPKLASLLTKAGEMFDIVVIDGPPIMGLADAPILASCSAGTLVIVEAGATRRGAVQACVKRLRFARTRISGVVLTKYDARKSGYAYGYGGYGYGTEGYGGQAAQLLGNAPTALPTA